jgi:hypothetical protein
VIVVDTELRMSRVAPEVYVGDAMTRLQHLLQLFEATSLICLAREN